MNYIKGIDVSHFATIDWHKLSPEVKFIYCKASQGTTFKDPSFNGYWQHLKTTDFFRGAYHFLNVEGTAQQQANNFLSLGIDFSKPNVLPPMLDIEDQVPASLNTEITRNKAAFIQLASGWIDIIQKETGRKVVIYSYKNFFHEYLNNHSWPDNYLWLASYQPTPPGLPHGYTKWDFWQYSEYGTIEGAATGGSVDMDYFNGTLEDLAKL